MFKGILIVVVAGALISASAGPSVDFSKDVKPSLKTYCVSCHGSTDPKGQVDLSKYKTNADVKKAKKVWATALKEIEGKKMPPYGAKSLPNDVRAKLVSRLKTLLK
jgi:cytochrome c553